MTTPITPTLVLTPARQAASTDAGTLDVLVRVQAPARPESLGVRPRTPLRLALVVDRSGSMAGEPLEEALRCVEYIAAGLTPQDSLAVVLYDDKVQVPLQLSPGGNPDAVRKALAGVDSGGSTALFDGWEQGAKLLEQGAQGTLSRVVLLSDGQANHGECDPAQIEKHCSAWQGLGVTTTTVGLGRAFNEDLMIGMARAGGGQQYYGQRAEDLHASFDEELSLLQSLFLRQLRLKLLPAAGVIPEPLGIVQVEADGRLRLPDLAWSAEAWVLVRLHVSAAHAVDPRQPQALLAVSLEAVGEDAAAPVKLEGLLSLPRVPASDIKGLPEDDLVARRRQEVEFGSRLEQARTLLASGDAKSAKRLLQALAKEVANHPWLASKVQALQVLLEQDEAMSLKEWRYSVRRSSGRLAAVNESVSLAQEIELPAFLRRKTEEGKGR